mgnify:CR=1 FL=1
MDIGCPICGKHEYPDHKCNPRTVKRWENRRIKHERELAEIKEPTLTERLEYAEALSKDNE